MLLGHVIVAVSAYLLGSIPFGYILVRAFRKQDIRQTGSGNIGATNVARSGAKGLAIATLLLDAGKGFAAVEIGKAIIQSDYFYGGRASRWDCYPLVPDCYLGSALGTAAMIAALCAVLGHMFPVWLRFRGGKGVATALGALLAIDPIPAAGALVVFVITVAVSRYVSLGSILAALSYPILLLALRLSRDWISVIWPICAIAGLVIIKHHQNIRRLFAGTENRLGAKA